jgi:hypothetical protein
MWPRAASSHNGRMIKRTVVGLAWFVSVGWGLNLVATLSDIPAWVGTLAAIGIAAFFSVDPFGVIWPRPAESAADRAALPARTYARTSDSMSQTT